MKRAIKNRRKGMTLVELIVGFALVAILSAALVGIIAPVYRTYQRTRAVSDAQALAGNIIDTIRTSANSAIVLSASDNTVTVGVVRYFVPEKPQRLMYEVTGKPAKPVFDEKYYDGKTITMTAKQPNPNVQTVEVTINVTTRDGVTVSQSGVISTMRQYIKGGYDIKPEETETPETNEPETLSVPEALSKYRIKYSAPFDSIFDAFYLSSGIYIYNGAYYALISVHWLALFNPLDRTEFIEIENVVVADPKSESLIKDLHKGDLYIYENESVLNVYFVKGTVNKLKSNNTLREANPDVWRPQNPNMMKVATD